MPSNIGVTALSGVDSGDFHRRFQIEWQDCSTAAIEVPVWSAPEVDLGEQFRKQFKELRNRADLPAETYALLLGASRRTLYHWLQTGRPREEAAETLELLAAWSSRLAHYVSGGELERLLDPKVPGSLGEYLIRKGRDVAEERSWEIVEEVSRPRKARRLEVLADYPSGEPPSASPEELKAALAAMATSREPVSRPPQGEPPELTY